VAVWGGDHDGAWGSSVYMAEDAQAVVRLALRQHGNVTRQQLLDLGLGADAIDYRARTGRLHRVHTGVYAVGRPAQTALERAAAAVLACGPQAALSHRSALALWGLAPWPNSFDVTIPRDVRRTGIRTHFSTTLTRRDLRRRHGIRTTSPARTLHDCAPTLTDKALARAVNDARLNGDLKLHDLAELLQRQPNPRLSPFIEHPTAPTRSSLEDAFQRFCERHGLPRPKTNARVAGYEVDALFEPHNLIVELDGYEFHRTRDSFERDRERDTALLAAGYTTVRITHDRLTATEAARLTEIMRRNEPGAATATPAAPAPHRRARRPRAR
jgi:very-short-patch-repair endonuclease